jgi:hypothetical protein
VKVCCAARKSKLLFVVKETSIKNGQLSKPMGICWMVPVFVWPGKFLCMMWVCGSWMDVDVATPYLLWGENCTAILGGWEQRGRSAAMRVGVVER